MSTQGLTLRVGQSDVYLEDQGTGGPTLVFLHYWGGSRRTWSAVIERLSDRFRCVAIDLRGWGRSNHEADNYALTTQADDVAGAIAALSLEDYALIGHSMGGKIAQMLAGRRPAGLRKVVLVAPAPPTPLLPPDEQKKTMRMSYTTPEGIAAALKVVTYRPLTLEQRLQVTEDSLGGALGAKLGWLEEGMPLDISEQAAKINVPVLVIAGSQDQVETPTALRAAILPLIPQAKFETILEVGHLSPLEMPAEVADAISDFLAA